MVLHRHQRTSIVKRIGRVIVRPRAKDTYSLASFCIECAATCIAVVTVRVVVHNQGHVGRTVVIERRIEIDGRPITGRYDDTPAKHQIAFRDRYPIGNAVKHGLVGADHIDVQIAGSAVCPCVEE